MGEWGLVGGSRVWGGGNGGTSLAGYPLQGYHFLEPTVNGGMGGPDVGIKGFYYWIEVLCFC